MTTPKVPWRKNEVKEHLDAKIRSAEGSAKRTRSPKKKAEQAGAVKALTSLRADLFGG
jgi:hypothetical protein